MARSIKTTQEPAAIPLNAPFSFDAPLSDECRNALAKGLGRARLWADAGCLKPDDLAWACVHDLRYDRQCEDNRADWLWMLIEQSRSVDACEERIWAALRDLTDELSASQLCSLAMHYALLGRERFKSRLFEIVQNCPIEDDRTLGEYELMVVAGLEGFLVVANKRGDQLREREWDWDDGYLCSQAIELFGEDDVEAALAADTSEDVQRFYNLWQVSRSAESSAGNQETHRERMQMIPIQEVLAASKTDSPCYWFSGWGRHADDADIRSIYDHIIENKSVDELVRLLRVFVRRALPDVDSILFDYCRSDHQELANAALRALKHSSHPDVRAHALACLQQGDTIAAVSLLVNNYQTGDEQRIVQAISIPDDADQRHGLLMSCRDLLETNLTADCLQLAFSIYEHNPCSLCRTAAVRLMKRQSVVPAWMLEEIRFDCDEGTRQLFYPQPSQFSLVF